MVSNFGSFARKYPGRARDCRSVFGQFRVKPDKDAVIAEIGLNELPIAAPAGGVPIYLAVGASLNLDQ